MSRGRILFNSTRRMIYRGGLIVNRAVCYVKLTYLWRYFRRSWAYTVLVWLIHYVKLPFVMCCNGCQKVFGFIFSGNRSASNNTVGSSEERSRLLPDDKDFPMFCSHERLPGRKDKVFTCHFGGYQMVHVYTSDIVFVQNVDILVCPETPAVDSKRKIAMELLRRGGQTYAQGKAKAFKKKAKEGDVRVCDGGSSGFKFVAHAVTTSNGSAKGKKGVNAIEKLMKNLYSEILNVPSRKKCESLALPVLGDIFTDVGILFGVLERRFKTHRERLSIHLVNKDKGNTGMTIVLFQSLFEKHAQMTAPSISKPPSIKTSPTRKLGKRPADHGQWAQPSSRDATSLNDAPLYGANDETRALEGSPTRRRSPCHRIDVTQKTETSDDDFGSEFWNTVDTRDTINDDFGSGFGNTAGKYIDSDSNTSSDDDFEQFGDACGATAAVPTHVGEDEPCVICMGNVQIPRTLACGHVFCKECIEGAFRYKKACPSCGLVLGVIEGDQPEGTMRVQINRHSHCEGYERHGRIEITYSFAPGQQGPNHPNPGAWYEGIRRTAYLPDNKQGNEILKMLEIAFDRKLIFTIGNSRTTGKEGVITWNDIHHKTDPRPYSQFGYPDDTYLDRVTDELKAKGVTPADIQGKRWR